MAKEVVFESERISKWERNKRFVIPAIAFVVVIVIAVVVALIMQGSRGETFTGGEDSPYPYSWTVNKDGSVLLEVDRSASPQYLWNISEESAGVEILSGESTDESVESFTLPVLSARPDRSQSGKKASILLTPTMTGRAVLLLDLRHKDNEQDQIYEMTILTEVLEENGKLYANLISITGTEQQGITHGGQETAFPYTISLNESGDLLITVTTQDSEEAPESEEASESVSGTAATWECVSDNEETVTVLGVLYGADDVTAYVRAGAEAGRCTVRMSAENAGVEITLDCEVREDGTILVLSHDITGGETAT